MVDPQADSGVKFNDEVSRLNFVVDVNNNNEYDYYSDDNNDIKYEEANWEDKVDTVFDNNQTIIKGLYTIAHIEEFPNLDDKILNKEQALLIYSLSRLNNPSTIVQIGMEEKGRICKNFIISMNPGGKIFSFDHNPRRWKLANKFKTYYKEEFEFKCKLGSSIQSSDINNRGIDILYINNITDYNLSKNIWKNIAKLLNSSAIVILFVSELDRLDEVKISEANNFKRWISKSKRMELISLSSNLSIIKIPEMLSNKIRKIKSVKSDSSNKSNKSDNE